MLNHSLGQLQNRFAVHQIEFVRVQASS
jgi:hypothetical protein